MKCSIVAAQESHLQSLGPNIFTANNVMLQDICTANNPGALSNNTILCPVLTKVYNASRIKQLPDDSREISAQTRPYMTQCRKTEKYDYSILWQESGSPRSR